jgi:hypothetical protein
LETKTWLRKAHNRKLISDEANKDLFKKLSDCHYLLNQYIKSIIPTPEALSGTLLREPEFPYGNIEDIDFPEEF